MSVVEEFPQTLQELLSTEDALAKELQDTTGSLLDLVAEFEKKHSLLVFKQLQLKQQSSGLRKQINVVETAVKKLTFPSYMSSMEELLKDFVDENNRTCDLTMTISNKSEKDDDEQDSSSNLVPSITSPSELVRFVGENAGAQNKTNVGLPPISKEEQIKFSSLFADGGLLESRSSGALGEQYFEVAGRTAPAPLPLTKSDQPDEALLDLAYVPFSMTTQNNNNNNNNNSPSTVVIRKRSPLTDISVMRCPSLGGRVLVSKRVYQPGQLLFCESPFLSAPKSTTALLPLLPPLLQRVVREMLALPQAQEAMKKQGWDPQLVNCVLIYLAQQTFDSMSSRKEGATSNNNNNSNNNNHDEKQNSSSSPPHWMWRSPAPLFRFTSGDFAGEDPQAKRRMRKMLFLGAPLQSMDTGVVHQFHKLAKFVFAALPPCYRDFEGDEQIARSAVSEWARRGLANAFDIFSDGATSNNNSNENGNNNNNNSPNNMLNQITMAPYDDNPAHRQVPVNPLGRESALVASDAVIPTNMNKTSGVSSIAVSTSTQNETEAALQLPPECRVSISDIVRIFSVFQTNCISIRDPQAFVSATVTSIEHAASRALNSGAQLPPAATQNGLYTFMSMLEHSCCPNAVWVPASTSANSNSTFGLLELRALRKIVPGERLRVSYVPPILPPLQRRSRLRSNFHFLCSCEACTGIDWCRPVVGSGSGSGDHNGNAVCVPFSGSGDWLKVSDGSIIARNSQEAASLVKSENAFYGNSSSAATTLTAAKKRRARKNLLLRAKNNINNEKNDDAKINEQEENNNNNNNDEEIDDEEEFDDEDDLILPNGEDDNNNSLISEPLKLVHYELEMIEKLLFGNNNSNNKDSSSIHPTHVASYLRAMRLCTAWTYLNIACISSSSLLVSEIKDFDQLSQRVHFVLLAFVKVYSQSLLTQTEAISIVEVLDKLLAASDNNKNNNNNNNFGKASTIMPSEPRSVFVYAALVPMLENICVAFTLENVIARRKNSTNSSSSSLLMLEMTDLWRVLIDLVEVKLGWERSSIAAKYRLYIANPTQCLTVPTEQPQF